MDGPTPPWVVRLISMEVGARMMDADSDYSTVPFCTCQAHPTHCANDCPQHGLDRETFTAGERVSPPELVVGHGRGVPSFQRTLEKAAKGSGIIAQAFQAGADTYAAQSAPVAGLLEFPRAVPPALMALVTAFCVGVTQSREPNKRIGRNRSPYMDRWFLARRVVVPAWENDYADVETSGGVARVSPETLPSELENVYLHGYHRGDADEPHDHPWPNASLVARGWYRERLFDERGQFVRCEMRRAGEQTKCWHGDAMFEFQRKEP